MLHEVAEVRNGSLRFVKKPLQSVQELLTPRKGVWFKFDEPGKIIVVWSHIQGMLFVVSVLCPHAPMRWLPEVEKSAPAPLYVLRSKWEGMSIGHI